MQYQALNLDQSFHCTTIQTGSPIIIYPYQSNSRFAAPRSLLISNR